MVGGMGMVIIEDMEAMGAMEDMDTLIMVIIVCGIRMDTIMIFMIPRTIDLGIHGSTHIIGGIDHIIEPRHSGILDGNKTLNQ